MNSASSMLLYGEYGEPATITIRRRLPGPIERVWDYLTKSDLRRQWLAAGDMQLQAGMSFELVWRNDELSDPLGKRPEGFGSEHRMQGRIVECEAPRKLVITWRNSGDVSFELEPKGNEVLLTVIHRRFADRDAVLSHAAGWHIHLDTLVARMRSEQPEPFWDGWRRLKQDYDRRIPA